jgi:hypothetical protein
VRLLERSLVHLRQQHEALRFSLPLVPVLTQVLHPDDVRKEQILCFARFGFHCTQVLHLDAQQRYFPPHYRYRIRGVRRPVRRKFAHEVMNVRSSGWIRHGTERAEAWFTNGYAAGAGLAVAPCSAAQGRAAILLQTNPRPA